MKNNLGKLDYCPICGEATSRLSTTLWECKTCKQLIELVSVIIDSLNREYSLKYLFTGVDKDGNLSNMQGRDRRTPSKGSESLQ